MKKKIIEKICREYECSLVRWTVNDQEVDIFIDKKNYVNLEKYLCNQWFFFQRDTFNKIHFYQYIDTEIVHIDITIDESYIFTYFPVWSSISLLWDSTKEKCLRYLLLIRRNRINFFIDNFDQLQQNNFYMNTLSQNIFSYPWEKITKKDIENFLQHRVKTVWKLLKRPFFASYICGRIKQISKNIGKGRILVCMWVDWSWKSTIIDMLHQSLWGKMIYMWWRDYYLQSFYDKYEKKRWAKLPIFLLRYTEQRIRWLLCQLYVIKGETVFVDRYPKRELITWYNIPHINRLLYTIFYRYVYPNPSKVVFLRNEPAILHKRKDELTTEEIDIYQESLSHILDKKRFVTKIKNDNLDETINMILSHLFHTTWK